VKRTKNLPRQETEFDVELRRQLFDRVGAVCSSLEALGYTDGMKARAKAAELAAVNDLLKLSAHVDDLVAELKERERASTIRGRLTDFFRRFDCTGEGLVTSGVLAFFGFVVPGVVMAVGLGGSFVLWLTYVTLSLFGIRI
jgi:hypothetical protein